MTVPIGQRGTTLEGRVLLESLHQDRARPARLGIERMSPTQWDQVVTLAGSQRVRPLLRQRLHETGQWALVHGAAWARLTHECRDIAVRKLRLHAELSRILTALSRVGIPAIVLKGAYLGPVVYGSVGLREMGDLDIMVERHHAEHACRLLLADGYAECDRFPADWRTATIHHASLTKPGIGLVEIHWALAPAGQPGGGHVDELWREASACDLLGQPTLCLSPLDQLLHIANHVSYQHRFEFGLRPYCDIQRLIEHFGAGFAWDAFVERARQRRCLRGAALALMAARALVGATVPAEIDAAAGNPAGIATQAMEISWVTLDEGFALPMAVGELAATGRWHSRLAIIWRRLLVPKSELLEFYRLPATERFWRLWYLKRAVYLIRKRSVGTLSALATNDQVMGALTGWRCQLRDWLAEE